MSRCSQRTRRVRFLDADLQGSVIEWAAQRERPPLFEVREHVEPSFFRELPELLLDGVDDLVIDCPAGTGRPGRAPDERTRIIRNAILTAISEPNGVVVGVVVPSGWELWANDDLMEVIEQAWEHESTGPHARSRTVLLLNRAKATRRGAQGRPDRVPRMVRAATAQLAQAPLPLLHTVIHDRRLCGGTRSRAGRDRVRPEQPGRAGDARPGCRVVDLAGEAKR